MTVQNLSILSASLFVFCLSINISDKAESKVLPISSKPMLFKSALLSSTQLIPPELCFSSLSFRLCSLSFPPGSSVWHMTHKQLAWSVLVFIALPSAPSALGVLFSLLVGGKCTVCVFTVPIDDFQPNPIARSIYRHTRKSKTLLQVYLLVRCTVWSSSYSQPCTLHLFHSSYSSQSPLSNCLTAEFPRALSLRHSLISFSFCPTAKWMIINW